MSVRGVAGPALVAALLVGCSGSPSSPATQPSDSPSPPPPTAATAPPTPSESAAAFPCDGTATTVAVYYLGYTDTASAASGRLFREFHRVPACPGGAVETAVTAMLDSPPEDPDYDSLWREGTRVLSVTTHGEVADVDLSDYTIAEGVESQTVQQLVWTVTAADRRVKRVRLTVDGAMPPTGSLDPAAFDAGRADALDTLAQAWILQPTQGASVGSPTRLRVYGTGFEGNVVLEVLRGSTVVRRTSVTTMMGGFARAAARVRLPGGSYTLKAYTDGGEDRSMTLWDTKDFTVP